jgi:hypothetical protein
MAASNDPATWEVMLDRYLREVNPQEKRKLMNGLAQV